MTIKISWWGRLSGGVLNYEVLELAMYAIKHYVTSSYAPTSSISFINLAYDLYHTVCTCISRGLVNGLNGFC